MNKVTNTLGKYCAIIFLVALCLDSYSQYSPFWTKERELTDYSYYQDYLSVIERYDDDQNISAVIEVLDSLALIVYEDGDYKQFLFLKNEVSNFFIFDNQFDKGAGFLHDAMLSFADNSDTLVVEYIASLRLLGSLLNRSGSEQRGSRELLESQLKILDKLEVRGEPLRNTLVNFGLFLVRQGNTNEAIDILYKARTYALQADDVASLALADYTIITNLPPIYDLQETTMEVLKNDVAMFEAAEPSIPILVYSTYFNYLLGSRYYSRFDNIEKGIYYTEKALAALETLQYPVWNLKASCNSILALMYADLKDTTSMWNYVTQAKHIADTKLMSDYNKSLAYVNIADAAVSVSADSAFVLLDSIHQQPGARFFRDKIIEIEAKGLMKQGKNKSAIKLIADLFEKFEKIEENDIPLISDSIDYLNQIQFISLMEDAYRASDDLIEENKKYHIIANLLIKQNQLYLEVVKRDVYGYELSSLVNKYHDFLMPSLEYLLSLEDAEEYQSDVLRLVFSSKAVQLNSNLVKSRIQKELENNESLFSKLLDISGDIQQVRMQLAGNMLSEDKEKELKLELNTLLVDNMMYRYRMLNDDEVFEMETFEVPTLAQMQDKLKPQEGILEYCLNDTTLIWSLITDNNAIIGMKHDENLSSKITNELRAIRTGRESTGIGALLFGDIEKEILGLQHLTIVPDKELSFIPFEWLTLPGTEKMLIEHLSVSYSYSSSLWYLLRDDSSVRYPKNILAIAPLFYESPHDADHEVLYVSRYRGTEKLSPLLFSKEEVASINNIFSTEEYEVMSLVGSDADIANTRKYIEQFDIVHMATHGLSDIDYPERSGLFLFPDNIYQGAAFGDDSFLSMGELLGMNLQAQLVVLSACDTGRGGFAEGEGVMALPRGFIFAGVPNVIASLWKVHDERTKDLMVAFYTHLHNGYSYAEALRLAKLDSIEKGFLPLDWAGFVLIGS